MVVTGNMKAMKAQFRQIPAWRMQDSQEVVTLAKGLLIFDSSRERENKLSLIV